MAHVVPRRDPCIKCNNPVFLAERLVIEDHLYHRTCFRCARCDSVLTLGNFYQTEKDNEFCCETCPDEELKSKRSAKDVESNRLSIAQRIALFEKSESSSVLKKSLSDEEKSKSLSRQLPPSTNSQALNSFLTSQIKSQETNVETDDDDEKTNESLSSDSESDDEDKHKNKTSKGTNLISERKLDDNSVHNKSISSDNNVNSTKEPTEHDNDIKSNAQTTNAQQQIESQLIKDTSSDGDVNLDTINVEDDIDLEFEKLAEEAMINPVTITTSRIINNNDELTALAPQDKPQIAVIINSDENTVKVPDEQIINEPDKEESLVVNEIKAEDDKLKEKVEEVLNDIEPEPVVDNVKVEEEEVKVNIESITTVETETVKEQSDPVIYQSEPVETESVITNTESVIKDSESVITDSESTITKPEPVITESEPKTTEPQLHSTSHQYPVDLNPFGDDEEEVEEKVNKPDPKRPSLNPFGSCSEDEEEEKQSKSFGTLQKPPRPPPPRTSMTLKSVSTNPFGSDDEDDDESVTHKNSIGNKTPVPTPRKQLHSITPEPMPRINHNSPGHSFKGSTSSLASSSDGTMSRRKKKKAPAPPVPKAWMEYKMQNGSSASEEDKTKTTLVTPKKKRPAPTPPNCTPIKPSVIVSSESTLYITASEAPTEENNSSDIIGNNDSVISYDTELDSINTTLNDTLDQSNHIDGDQRRLIPLEESLAEDSSISQCNSHIETQEVTYRRKIVPLSPTSPDECENLEQMKDHKEAENRHRQSQSSLKAESIDSLPYINKSSHGKWKRRKGPAPSLPGFAIPQRRVLQMLPLQEIRHELEVIEVQQQGLEKQGVMLEKMIRERCEGVGDNRTTEELLESLPSGNAKNPKEVEELILQLFELVNEKNELFRRQAELMYLRRAHRLEEEQADVEYEIRTLMAQPEQNKTDSDKTKEEALIARLVDIVQLRNEVVDCLEMDRLREAEEDLSIKQRMESHTAKLDQEYLNQTPTKLSKKEKKKLKEAKKMKNKKLNDADKDLDTSEIKPETTEKKKKKKKFLF
ncbi:protein-methionine sulfoxide oxidase mical3b isoform X2 [Chironomus tepperi]